MNIVLFDRQSYGISKREVTDEGFLKVPGRVARVGVQYYLASELGLTDRDPMERIGVYRPPEEVFKPESMASYAHKDATDDHPKKMVDSETFKAVSIGHVMGPATQDPDDPSFLIAPLLFKDAKAIEKIKSGKAELSAGYSAEYEQATGTDPNTGEKYEFIQRDIRINHVALVDAARAGRQARLFDQKGNNTMKVIVLDAAAGTKLEIEDANAATMIQSTIDGLRKRAEDAEKEKDMAYKEKEKAEAQKDEAEAEMKKKKDELEKEKEKTSDSAINARLVEISEIKDQAAHLVGNFDSGDLVDTTAIKRKAMADHNPNIDWTQKDDGYVNSAFDYAIQIAEKQKVDDSHKQFAQDAKGAKSKAGGVADARKQNFDSYVANLTQYNDKKKAG